MRLTSEDIKTYIELQKKIGKFVFAYFDEFIRCDNSYELESWNITHDLTGVVIEYSFTDHYDSRCYDDTTVTIEDLNDPLVEYNTSDMCIFYSGEPTTDDNLFN